MLRNFNEISDFFIRVIPHVSYYSLFNITHPFVVNMKKFYFEQYDILLRKSSTNPLKFIKRIRNKLEKKFYLITSVDFCFFCTS